ncbi:MAG: hypothetical protein HZA88_23205 [Verrucomicrobia bacterium]|nr:hypothetical protein [Verrucomicrobiota bacterium]
MKSLITSLMVATALAGIADAQTPDISDMTVAEHRAGGDASKLYFLIRKPGEPTVPKEGHPLLLVMPGGDGSAEFQQFIKQIAKNAVPDGWWVAQLVAPVWDKRRSQEIVWPTARNRFPAVKFTTEQFIAAIVAEVARAGQVDFRRIFTLSWSSGGPAAYAASLDPTTRVTGSFVAMSVFKPQELSNLAAAKGRLYYVLHSPQDFIPITMAENARATLQAQGARVEFKTYEGGHGWHGDIFGMIREGLSWLAEHASNSQTKISQPGRPTQQAPALQMRK